MRKSVRFTDRVGGRYRVITLKRNEMVSFNWGGPTEEGFHSTEVTYCFDGKSNTVAKTEYSEWRDCDGPGSRNKQFHCKVECLWSNQHMPSEWAPDENVWMPTGELIKLPMWGKPVRDYCFDAFAQAAGY